MKAAALILLAILIGTGALGPGPACARTPLEREWSGYQDWQVTSFALEGTPAGLEGDLRGGLALAGKGRLLRGRAYPAFRFRLLKEDLARVRLFLAREGYPAAVVEPVAIPDPRRDRLGIVLRIDPGPRVLAGSVAAVGWPGGQAPPRFDSPQGIRQGDQVTDRRLEWTRARLQGVLRDSGHALAEVKASVQPRSEADAAVVFIVDAGPCYTIAEVATVGLSPNLDGVTRRIADVTPPVPYSESLLAARTFDLRTTQLYRQVSLEVAPTGSDSLRLEIRAQDARMRSLEASVGTWSDNPWMVRTGWMHRNLLGGGRGVDLRGGLALHTQSVGGGVTWLGWLSPRSRTRAGAAWVREDEDAYTSRELSLDLVQSFRPRLRDPAHVGFSLSRVTVEAYGTVDQEIVDRAGNLFEIWADRQWDRTDDPLYPGRGGFVKLSAVWSPPVGLSETPYLSLQADGSLYRPLGRIAVLAGRLRAGYARPLGGAAAVLPNRRFYAGGYSTMRGYGRRRLGPRDENDIARGGDAVLLGGLELRIPVVWRIELAGFLDSGQVWWRPGDVRLADLRTAAGFDLDVRTPLGPVRLGYAWNLDDVVPGEPRTLGHFGVGYPW